jgi:hypothetical protein
MIRDIRTEQWSGKHGIQLTNMIDTQQQYIKLNILNDVEIDCKKIGKMTIIFIKSTLKS